MCCRDDALSRHDALPIYGGQVELQSEGSVGVGRKERGSALPRKRGTRGKWSCSLREGMGLAWRGVAQRSQGKGEGRGREGEVRSKGRDGVGRTGQDSAQHRKRRRTRKAKVSAT